MTDLTLSEALARFAGNVYDLAELQNNVPRFRGWFDLETGAHVLTVDIVGDPRLPYGQSIAPSWRAGARWWSAS